MWHVARHVHLLWWNWWPWRCWNCRDLLRSDLFLLLVRQETFNLVNLMDLILEWYITSSCSCCCFHAGCVSVPGDTLVFSFLLAEFLTNRRFLIANTENICTSFGQLLETCLDGWAGCVDLLLADFFKHFVALFDPAWIQETNTHVLGNFRGGNLLASDWGNEVLLGGWWWFWSLCMKKSWRMIISNPQESVNVQSFF